MQEFELAYLAHRTPTRVRLSLPARRNDAAFFGRLTRQLLACEGLLLVDARPRAASITLLSRPGFNWSALDLSALGLALVDNGPAPRETTRPRALTVATRLTAHRSAPWFPRGSPTGNSEFLAAAVIQVASLVLARQPLLALLQWLGECVLRSLLSHLFSARVAPLRC